MSDIFDGAGADEIEALVNQNPAPEVPEEVLSSVKRRVYENTGLSSRKKSRPSFLRWQTLIAAVVGVALIIAAVTVLPALRGQGTNNEGDTVQTSGNNDTPGSKTMLELESPPDNASYSFETYQSLKQALTVKSSADYSGIREKQADCGRVYERTLTEYESGEIKVAIPQIDGRDLPLRNREGLSNITLMTDELYNLPWVWYHCLAGERDLQIQVAYPSVLGNAAVDSAKSYYEVLKLITDKAPGPDNYGDYEDYSRIYEQDITLRDGSTVIAMVSELKNSTKKYVMYYQDGMMVILYADTGLLTDEFFGAFGFAK